MSHSNQIGSFVRVIDRVGVALSQPESAVANRSPLTN
jgi:hypothetical protein